MTDIKKLANMIRHNMTDSNVLSSVADALDAYADAQKPVAWRTKKREWDNGGLKRYYVCSESCGDGKSPFREGAGEPLYAAPPLPSVSRESWDEAFYLVGPDARVDGSRCYYKSTCENVMRALGINVTGDKS